MITIESADVWNDHVVVVCALESQKIKLVLNSSSVFLLLISVVVSRGRY